MIRPTIQPNYRTNNDEIFLSLCLGINIIQSSNSEILKIINELDISYITEFYQNYLKRQEPIGFGYWINVNEPTGGFANLAVQDRVLTTWRRF